MMSTDDTAQFLVTHDPELAADLAHKFEHEMDTPTLTEYVTAELGMSAPDDRPGWSIGYAYGPDGEDIGVVWSPPSYPEE